MRIVSSVVRLVRSFALVSVTAFAVTGWVSSASASVILACGSTTPATTCAGTQADPTWQVTVDNGISLSNYQHFANVSNFNNGYTTGTGHILDFVQTVAGFSNAALITGGQVTTTSYTGTTASLFVVHYGCGTSNQCFDVFSFSGNTTFTVDSLHGFSDINAFTNARAVPGPIAGAGLPGIAAACGALLALFARRRRLKMA